MVKFRKSHIVKLTPAFSLPSCALSSQTRVPKRLIKGSLATASGQPGALRWPTLDREDERAFYCSIRTQYSNLGDEVINQVLVHRLSRLGTVHVYARGVPEAFAEKVLDGAPGRVVRHNRLASLCGALVKRMFSARRSVIVLGPGDKHGASLAQAFGLRALSILARARFGQVGASYRTFGRRDRIVFARWGRREPFATVRDARSVAFCKQRAGVEFDYAPDLAFGLGCATSSDSEARTVVFTFRTHGPELHRPLMEAITALAGNFRKADLRLVCTWQVSVDAPYMRSIAEAIGAEVVEPADDRLSMEEAGRVYSDARYIISNRLHALLIAASCGTIPVALLSEKDAKVAGVFRAAGLDGFIADPLSVANVVASHNSDRPAARARVSETFRTVGVQLSAYFDLLK